MEKDTIIVEMTPFLFEDGKTYYFDIRKGYSNSYHYLFVYNKIENVTERTTWFGFAKQIYSNLNQATHLVIPTQTTTNNSTVIRPEFTVLSHRCWSNIGFGPMADWTQALALDLPAIVSKIRSEV